MSCRQTIRLIRSNCGVDAADFEQLKAEGLDLGKHTEETRLVEGSAEHRLAILVCGIQVRKAGEQGFTQKPADMDLALQGLCRSFHGEKHRPRKDEPASTGSYE
jgi:hypothetical protein